MLGIAIDCRLNFTDYIPNIVQNVCDRLFVLRQLLSVFDFGRYSYRKKQFNYFPLIWIFHGKNALGLFRKDSLSCTQSSL